MSFATLEEAWGVPKFAAADSPPALLGGAPRVDGPDGAAWHPRHRRPTTAARQRWFGSERGEPRPRAAWAGAAGPLDRPDDALDRLDDPLDRPDDPLGPGSDDRPLGPVPRSEADAATVQETRRFLARTYARFGVPGLVRLLPREAAMEMGVPLRRDRLGVGDRIWNAILRALSTPETVLFFLLAAFAVVLLWERREAAPQLPSLASLHMAPFPLGTSSM